MRHATLNLTQMLRPQPWEKVLKVPLSQNGSSFEFYGDSAFQRIFTFEPKTSRSRSFETGGAQLIIQETTGAKTYHSTLLNPEIFSALIEANQSAPFPCSFTRGGESSAKSWDRAKEIEQTCRRILLELGNVQDFKARYEEITKNFLFASSESPLREGQDNLACFTVEFSAKKGEQTRQFRMVRGRTDLESISADLEKAFIHRERLDKALQHPWPSPKGRNNILWSPSSVAKLLLQFIQYLEIQSRDPETFKQLKSRCSPFAFQVIDNWKQGNRIDVEGRPRKETLLVDRDRSFCFFNEEVAGFSRRNSARDFPMTAPWEPALFGLERDSQLKSHLGNGIAVHELNILSFDPDSGIVKLQITEAALVHQGVEGEYIEPTIWELSLLDLLSSFKLFSESSSPHPLIWSRSGQRLFVEVTTPEALSPSLEFPGTVPLSYYW